MKLVGSGYIQRLFAASDEQTILRRPNIRRYAKENGITYHERQIDKHVIEKCMQSDKVFKYNHGNRWIINYDELEPIINDFLDKKVGINLFIPTFLNI